MSQRLLSTSLHGRHAPAIAMGSTSHTWVCGTRQNGCQIISWRCVARSTKQDTQAQKSLRQTVTSAAQPPSSPPTTPAACLAATIQARRGRLHSSVACWSLVNLTSRLRCGHPKISLHTRILQAQGAGRGFLFRTPAGGSVRQYRGTWLARLHGECGTTAMDLSKQPGPRQGTGN